MSQVCFKLDHPSCLFVFPPRNGNDCFEFQLPFFPERFLGLGNKRGRIFALQRSGTEAFSRLATLFVQNINKHFNQAHKNLNHESPIRDLQATDFTLDCSQSGPSDSLSDIFSTPKPMQIRLSVKAEITQVFIFDVRFNPACVTSLKLDLKPFVDCPLCPALIQKNLDFGYSKFEWFVSTSKAESVADAQWEEDQAVHEGFFFTPQPEHVGHFVRLRVRPYDAEGLPGVSFGDTSSSNNTTSLPLPSFGQFVVCPKPIAEAPPQAVINDRCRTIASRVRAANEFRLVSYNLLAYMYSTSKSAFTYFFRHCPPAYLMPEYRFPLIYRELLAYQADVLCLQEVDTSHFHRRLSFLLQQAGGFEGCFHPKLLIEVPADLKSLPKPQPISSYPRKDEGSAIFFRRERFRLVKKVVLDSMILHAVSNYPDLARAYHELEESGEVPLYLCMRSLAQGVLVCLLECQHTRQHVLVATTHLYFQPTALKLRKIQCHVLRRFLYKLAHELAESDRLPIILAADLNAEPGSESYRCLTRPFNDLDAQGPRLEAAIPLPEGVFTNIVPGFKANLDAVLYSSPHQQHGRRLGRLQVAHAFPVPTEEAVLTEGRNAQPEFPPLLTEANGGFTLPNSQFPSDHLALVADFSINPLLQMTAMSTK